MGRLSHSQTLAVLKSVQILNSDISAASLPKRAFRAVAGCVKADISAFDGFGADTHFSGPIFYDPADSISAEQYEAFAAHTHEHPFFGAMLLEKRSDTLMISDFLPDRSFCNTGIYNEFYRIVGVKRQMAVALNISDHFLVTSALSRIKRSFSECDRNMLGLLSPHLITAFRNTQLFEALSHERDYLSQIASKGLIVLDPERKIEFISELAIRLLEKYFSGGSGEMLTGELKCFVDHELSHREPLSQPGTCRKKLDGCELSVRIAFDSSSGRIRLLLEERRDLSASDLAFLNLTVRETEILFWLCNGKSDFEIACLLAISIRTVQKHVENTLIKLGVETRTAAVAAAFGHL